MSIKDKAMISYLNISIWCANKQDNEVTNHIGELYDTDGDAGRFKKKLIKSFYLDQLKKLAAETRQYYYSVTLPWFNDGSRILPTERYFDFLEKVDNYKGRFDNIVKQFLLSYEEEKEKAKKTLGNMFKEEDYPEEKSLRKKFKFKIILTPFPDIKDFRINLSKEEIDSIQETLESHITEATRSAHISLFKKLHKVISHVVDKLSIKDKVFRDSLINNVRDLVEIMPSLNVLNDPILNNLIAETKGILEEPSVLRDSPIIRQKTADKAKEILDKMKDYIV